MNAQRTIDNKIRLFKKLITQGISIILVGMIVYFPIYRYFYGQMVYNQNQPESLKRQKRIRQEITEAILPYQAKNIIAYRKENQDHILFRIELSSYPEKKFLESKQIQDLIAHSIKCREDESLSVADSMVANHVLKITWTYPDNQVKFLNENK